MGKGGGGGPQKSTTETSNIPEYARPYVMNMLGAAQNQLFTNTPGTTNADGTTTPGQITGFKPYSAYSSNPTDYFAGPSSLQNSAYNAAGQLQSPSQYQTGTQLAGMAGLGQFGTAQQAGMYGQQGNRLGMMGAMQAMPAFGAGQQYSNQVTDPNAVGSYMSPYQQQVTDVAKNAAVREAQIASNQANLGAARQGTYGGARQALAGAERERNLLGNLSNIQAQGSQSAYDRAIQNMQYGSNLGLQGIQTGLQGISAGQQGVSQGLQGVGAQQAGYAGAGQAASTLGQLGSAQNATDVQNINLQNQLGGQQQQYQQGIINQAIQDYATQQQYPYMQLSTMSNLLRGLPMQGMSTQQYQAQAPMAQQAAGLLGAYGAYKGGFKEGGAVQSYDVGGSIKAKAEKMLEADPDGSTLKGLLAATKSPQQRIILNEVLSGIATAPTGKLGTNMAGGGIVAFEDGGKVQHFYDQGLVDAQQKEDQKSVAETAKKLGLSVADVLALVPRAGAGILNAGPIRAARAYGANLPYIPDVAGGDFSSMTPFYDKYVRQDEASKDVAKILEKPIGDQPGDYSTPAAAPAAVPPGAAPAPAAAPNPNINPGNKMGIDDAYAKVLKLTGQDQTPQEMTDYLNMLKEKSGKVGEISSEAGRMNKALAFLEAGSTPGGLGAAAIAGGKSFLTGEAANREKYSKMELEYGKMQSDYRRAEIERSKGNFEAAEKLFDKAEDRKNRIETATIAATASGKATQFEQEAIDRIMKEENVSYAQALERVKGAGRSEGIDMQISKEAYKTAAASIAPGGANSKKYKELMKEDPTGVAAKQFVTDLAQEQIRGMKATMGMGGGSGGSGKVIDFGSIK